MIDLHIHTTYSDGSDSPIEILKQAEKLKLTYISITDHNNCNVYKELEEINIKEYYSGKIIPGVELNTIVLDIPIEVLGYNFNINVLQKNLKGMYYTPKEVNLLELNRLYAKCLQAKVKVDSDFINNYDPSEYVSKYFHRYLTEDESNKHLIEEDAWKDSLVLYRKYLSNPESIFFVNTQDIIPNLDKVISLIRSANGKVFLPHIFEYKQNAKKILNYILDNYQIDGIECYYSSFTKTQTKELLNICKEKHLLISGGSDYHGTHLPGIELGVGKGNLSIPDSIVESWNK